jgi:1-deoxy-D-xylulose-5-phosphate synthase
VRNLDRPVVVHVITRKGKGYGLAEDDPGAYHGVSSFTMEDGLPEERKKPSFTDALSRAILAAGRRDPGVVAVTAAMEKGTGLAPFKKEFPRRFFDTGIAEEHAVTFSAALAAQGLRPVVCIYSTFIQRSVDQIIHDTALQNFPVIFALDRSGFVGADGETHQGLFDLAIFRSVPNMTILAPATGGELAAMLDWALTRSGPCVIRYPKAPCPPGEGLFAAPLEQGRGLLVRHTGGPLCLAFTGSLYPQALEAADILAARGIGADLYNLRFIKPVDEDYLEGILNRYEMVIFIEEGVLRGGFGEYAAALAMRRDWGARVLALGVPDKFIPQGTREELLRNQGLDGPGIAGAAWGEYERTRRPVLHRGILR